MKNMLQKILFSLAVLAVGAASAHQTTKRGVHDAARPQPKIVKGIVR